MHGYKLDTEWQKKRPIRNLTDCLRELNLTAESPCLQLVCELLHAANLQISHQLEQFRADNEETRWDERLQRQFVKEKVLTNVKIRQVNAARFNEIQTQFSTLWEEFSIWVEELWIIWTRLKSKGVKKKEVRRINRLSRLAREQTIELEDEDVQSPIIFTKFPAVLSRSRERKPAQMQVVSCSTEISTNIRSVTSTCRPSGLFVYFSILPSNNPASNNPAS